VIYYGDEIGMTDDLSLPDRYTVRTPMIWADDPVSVAEQEADQNSLPNRTRSMIGQRRKDATLYGTGKMILVDAPNPHNLTFIRKSSRKRVLVAANFAPSAQKAEIVIDSWPKTLKLGPYEAQITELDS
jgi:maltose alpha-D-glucosyltransferase/alpha-amylase